MLLLACGASTGCQIDVAGQTLPSPYHLTDDVQYYAPGPEFKLANEAAALQEQRAQEISEPQAEGLMAPGPMRPAPIPAVPPAPGGRWVLQGLWRRCRRRCGCRAILLRSFSRGPWPAPAASGGAKWGCWMVYRC